MLKLCQSEIVESYCIKISNKKNLSLYTYLEKIPKLYKKNVFKHAVQSEHLSNR